MNRMVASAVMNVIVPGTGMILLGRTWLGLALAVWFALAAQVALGAVLVAPAMVPPWLVATCTVLAVAAWLLAQGVLIARVRFLRDPGLPEEMTLLRERIEAALDRRDTRTARSLLNLALSIDDNDLATRILWARLLTISGSRARAVRAWRGAARLDTEGHFRREIGEALERLRTA